MHEHPMTACKRVAVLPGDRGTSCRADVGEEKVRMQMPAQISQVLVRPSRTGFMVKAGLRVSAVPAQPKTVAIGFGGRFQCRKTLRRKRVLWHRDVIFQRYVAPAIGNPTAHSVFPGN